MAQPWPLGPGPEGRSPASGQCSGWCCALSSPDGKASCVVMCWPGLEATGRVCWKVTVILSRSHSYYSSFSFYLLYIMWYISYQNLYHSLILLYGYHISFYDGLWFYSLHEHFIYNEAIPQLLPPNWEWVFIPTSIYLSLFIIVVYSYNRLDYQYQLLPPNWDLFLQQSMAWPGLGQAKSGRVLSLGWPLALALTLWSHRPWLRGCVTYLTFITKLSGPAR